MRVVGLILRAFSILFLLLASACLLIVGALAWSTGQHSLQITLLQPWTGVTLTYVTFFSGLAGAVITFLAAKRILTILFVLWSLAVLAMLVRGFFFTSYNFGPGSIGISNALYLIAAALVSVLGAWLQFRSRRSPKQQRKSVYE